MRLSELSDAAMSAWGRIDGVVNNAAALTRGKPAGDRCGVVSIR